MVNSGCLGSLISELAEAPSKKGSIWGTVSSMESSLTSSESSRRNKETIALPLDDIQYNQAEGGGHKRSGSTVSNANYCVEQPSNKRSETQDDTSEEYENVLVVIKRGLYFVLSTQYNFFGFREG